MSVDQCSVHRKLRCEMDEETQPEAVLKPIKMDEETQPEAVLKPIKMDEETQPEAILKPIKMDEETQPEAILKPIKMEFIKKNTQKRTKQKQADLQFTRVLSAW